jgi:hypothetical protein
MGTRTNYVVKAKIKGSKPLVVVLDLEDGNYWSRATLKDAGQSLQHLHASNTEKSRDLQTVSFIPPRGIIRPHFFNGFACKRLSWLERRKFTSAYLGR